MPVLFMMLIFILLKTYTNLSWLSDNNFRFCKVTLLNSFFWNFYKSILSVHWISGYAKTSIFNKLAEVFATFKILSKC